MIEYFISLTIAVIFLIAFILFGIKPKASFPLKKYFIAYAAISFIQIILGVSINNLNIFNLEDTYAIEYSINIFNLIEIILFAAFYFTIIKSSTNKKIIVASILIFICWILTQWILKNRFNLILRSVTLIEAFIFILFSLFYFFELLKNPSISPLHHDSNFWIVIGIFLLFSILFPLFLFKDYLGNIAPNLYSSIYTANNIGYAILYYCLTKATKCSLLKIR